MTAPGGGLLAWLESAISAREDAALAATDGPWEETGIGDFGWTVSAPSGALFETGDSQEGRANARHTVLNDPEAVLRRCAADRKLLELHRPAGGVCTVCAAEEAPSEDSEGEFEWSRDALPAPCATLLTLAEGYGWTEGER